MAIESTSSLQWRQKDPLVWQRAVDEIEEFYAAVALLYKGSGRMFFGITGFASISLQLQPEQDRHLAWERLQAALQKAWLTLRFNHPTLASQITEDPEKQTWIKTYRQLSGKQDQDEWLKRTLVHVAEKVTGLEWANSDPPAPEIPTLFVVVPPVRSDQDDDSVFKCDLVFRSPHDVIDGMGTLMMLDNLLAEISCAYDQGDAHKVPALDGSETANLTPCYRVAADVPSELTEQQKARIQDNLANREHARAPPAGTEVLVLPYRKGAVLPGRHQRAALTIGASGTKALLAACKTAGVTPTHVFHAAAAAIDRDLQPKPTETKRVRYINYILRNERAACSPPYNSASHPAGVFHSISGQSLVVDMVLQPSDKQPPTQEECNREFLSLVDVMKDFYHQVRDDVEHPQLAPELWRMGVPKLPSSPRPLPVPGPNPSPSVSISSMGRVDSVIKPVRGPFKVHDAWVTGEELTNGLGLFLGTFEGRLCLSAAYNDAWHTAADVEDFLERCKIAVFSGLAIEESPDHTRPL